MKSCFTCFTIIGLAIWTVGCGSADSDSPATPAPDTSTELGSPSGLDTPPGGIEAGSATGGIADTTDESTTEDTSSEDTSSEDASSEDTSSEEDATDGPALP